MSPKSMYTQEDKLGNRLIWAAHQKGFALSFKKMHTLHVRNSEIRNDTEK